MVCIFRNELNKINNTKARMSDSIYHTTFDLLIPRSRGGGGGGLRTRYLLPCCCIRDSL